MPFTWADFIEIAKFLRVSGKDDLIPADAAFRCAISRAYYAAFCHAKNHAAFNGQFSPTGGEEDHGLLREAFRAQGRGDISGDLDKLRQWRNECDYNNSSMIPTDKNTGFAIYTAEKIINQLS